MHQVELSALVQIQRLIDVVRLNPNQVCMLTALIDGDAVGDPRRVTAQQAFAIQADLAGVPGIPEPAQRLGHVSLSGHVQRRLHAHVQPIQVGQATDVQHRQEMGADGIERLALHEGSVCRRRPLLPEDQRLCECRIAQLRADDAGPGQESQIGLGEAGKLASSREQVVRGSAQSKHEAQHLLIDLRRSGGIGNSGRRLSKPSHRVVQIRAIPDMETVPEADHLAESCPSGQRRRVQVIDENASSRPYRIGPVQVSTSAGRDDLPELLDRRGRTPSRRMPELL